MTSVVPSARTPLVPRARPISGAGAVFAVCACVLSVTAPYVIAPAASFLVALIAVAGLALVAHVRRVRAEALALGLGAGIPLLTAAAVSPVAPAATAGVGAALAVVGVAAWRLQHRREWAPWYMPRGVVAASVGAVLVLLAGVGALTAALASGQASAMEVASAAAVTVLPWSGVLAAAGWLRATVAVAVMTPAGAQVVAVLLTS